ncbi:MAG: NUDIX hydrolase [Pseudomonadota bacterium]
MQIPYCSACGAATHITVPAGDNRQRAVCGTCGIVHYVNPKVVCGCLLTCGDDILLAKRGIEPRLGYWTIPAGFMETGETTLEAAVRECDEEALAQPIDPTLYGLITLPRISQVYVMYRGEVAPGAFGVGDESTDIRLFAEDELPWDELSFPIVEYTLRRFVAERRAGSFGVFDINMRVRPGEPLPDELIHGLVNER